MATDNEKTRETGGTQESAGAGGLGSLLVEAGLVTQRQLEYALDIQKTQGRKLGDILVEQRFITPDQCTVYRSEKAYSSASCT